VALVAALAAVVIVLPASPALARGRLRSLAPAVLTCSGTAVSRPSGYVIACGDGGIYLTHLDWLSWTRHGATARGEFVEDTCQPTCAKGTYQYFRAVAHLSDPVATATSPLYSALTVRYRSKSGTVSTFSFPLLTEAVG
jgi:hypothetical protein